VYCGAFRKFDVDELQNQAVTHQELTSSSVGYRLGGLEEQAALEARGVGRWEAEIEDGLEAGTLGGMTRGAAEALLGILREKGWGRSAAHDVRCVKGCGDRATGLLHVCRISRTEGTLVPWRAE